VHDVPPNPPVRRCGHETRHDGDGVAKFSGDGGGNARTAGTLGVGKETPGQKLEFNGGVRLNTLTLKPTCDATTRGTFWVTLGGAGVEDLGEVCTKDASEVYAWRNVI